MSPVVIAIPIYKAVPDDFENISLEQCVRILGHYPIVFFASANLDTTFYQTFLSEKQIEFRIEIFEYKYFEGIDGYNKLMLSRKFYKRFSNFKYLLIYQLDAFIFKDDLMKWIDRNYDYIGSPWFENLNKSIDEQKLTVGNGGFSLRKIASFNKILKKYFYKNSEYHSGFRNLIKAYFKFPFHWLKNKLGENYTLQKFCSVNEDQFYCDILPLTNKQFKIAPVEEAITFSFEVNPKQLYEYNEFNLPMGCHAWWRYDLEFWKPFIEMFKFKIPEKQ